MKVLKCIAGLVLLMLVVVSLLYWHYFYAVTPIRPELKGVYSEHDLQSGLHARHFGIYRPLGHQHAMPVFVVLHGSMGDADSIRKRTAYEFETLADQHQFIVVYPDGYKHHWNGCRRSADYAANTEGIDDVGFMRELISWLASHYSIDKQKVYFGGYSNGGHLSYRMALEAPELVAGIATFSANLPSAANLGCDKSAVAKPVLMFAGTNDPINPYHGGTVVVLGNDSRGDVMSAQASAEYWAALAGDEGKGQVLQHVDADGDATTHVVEQRWAESSLAEVRLYTLQGSGHVIPSQLKQYPRIFGGSAGDISGPAEMVNFFLQAGEQSNGPVAAQRM